MPKTADVTLVYNTDGDWVAIYLNGTKVREDDIIPESDVVHLLVGYHVLTCTVLHRDLNRGSSFPAKLEDLWEARVNPLPEKGDSCD